MIFTIAIVGCVAILTKNSLAAIESAKVWLWTADRGLTQC